MSEGVSTLLPYVVCLLAGYIAGSFPTAFLLVRWKSRIDIRHAGSGNVGTANTLDVTGSKALSLAVLALDVAKGALAVLISKAFGSDPWLSCAAGIGAVAGHNYPVWLRFHGGRGLATAAGVFLLTGWAFVPLWLALFGLAYARWRDVHTGNVLALLLAPMIALAVPYGDAAWRALMLALTALMLLRHADVFGAVRTRLFS